MLVGGEEVRKERYPNQEERSEAEGYCGRDGYSLIVLAMKVVDEDLVVAKTYS
jgi:hypothetical protein